MDTSDLVALMDWLRSQDIRVSGKQGRKLAQCQVCRVPRPRTAKRRHQYSVRGATIEALLPEIVEHLQTPLHQRRSEDRRLVNGVASAIESAFVEG